MSRAVTAGFIVVAIAIAILFGLVLYNSYEDRRLRKASVGGADALGKVILDQQSQSQALAALQRSQASDATQFTQLQQGITSLQHSQASDAAQFTRLQQGITAAQQGLSANRFVGSREIEFNAPTTYSNTTVATVNNGTLVYAPFGSSLTSLPAPPAGYQRMYRLNVSYSDDHNSTTGGNSVIEFCYNTNWQLASCTAGKKFTLPAVWGAATPGYQFGWVSPFFPPTDVTTQHAWIKWYSSNGKASGILSGITIEAWDVKQ